MTDAVQFRVNERCIIGMPTCGYGFASSRMCFVARPAEGEFQLEEDILTQVLRDRQYETYVALQRIDPGNFAFCTKICSKIITAQFCVVLLNRSTDTASGLRVPNPNVYFEYGMMLSFHKHVIPMQRENETLPFNIYPIDTVKYRPENFKQKAEAAVDDAILRFKAKEPSGRGIGAGSEVIKYMSFRGLKFSDVETPDGRALFRLGDIHGFNLLDGEEGILYLGLFHDEEPREIVVRLKFLLSAIGGAYKQLELSQDDVLAARARSILDRTKVEVMIPETADAERMASKIVEFQPQARRIDVSFRKKSEIEASVHAQYESLGL